MKKSFLLALLLFQFALVSAQPGTGGDPGRGQPTPIGGLEVLMVAGGILGASKFLKDFRRKTK